MITITIVGIIVLLVHNEFTMSPKLCTAKKGGIMFEELCNENRFSSSLFGSYFIADAFRFSAFLACSFCRALALSQMTPSFPLSALIFKSSMISGI